MKKGFLPVAALAALALSATPAPAFFSHSTIVDILYWPGYDVYPPGTTFQKQVVSGYQPHWYPQQVPTKVPRVTYRLQTTAVKTYVYEPKEVEEKHGYVTYVPVARLVDKEETTCVWAPTILSDPAHMPILTWLPQIRTHTLKVTVHDMQPVVKYTTVKVTKMVPKEKITEYQQVVPIVVYDEALTMQWQAVQVPYQQLVTVPTYDPHHAVPLFWP